MAQSLWKTVWHFLINIHLSETHRSHSQAYTREMKTYVHTKTWIWMLTAIRLIIIKILEIPFNWRMEKQTVVKPQNRLLLRYKEETTSALCNSTDEMHLPFAQWRPNLEGYTLNDFLHMIFLISFKGLGGLEKNTGEFWRVLEFDCGRSYITTHFSNH